jgi:hypothetical protein
MSHWNLKRAARFGYLAGRGLSIESIMADEPREPSAPHGHSSSGCAQAARGAGPNRDLDDEHQSGWFALRQVLATHGPGFQRHRGLEEDLVRQAAHNQFVDVSYFAQTPGG